MHEKMGVPSQKGRVGKEIVIKQFFFLFVVWIFSVYVKWGYGVQHENSFLLLIGLP